MATALKTTSPSGIWAGELLEQGWCVVPNLVPEALVARLDADLGPHFERTLFCQGDFYGERTKRLGSLLTRSEHSAAFVQHPLVIDIVERVLRPYCDCIQLTSPRRSSCTQARRASCRTATKTCGRAQRARSST